MLPSESKVAQRGVQAGLYPDMVLARLDELAQGMAIASEDDVAKLLVESNLATRYQVGMLLRGFTQGFYVDGFKIIDQLASDPLAKTFSAVDQATGKQYLLSALRPSMRQEEMIRRFEECARTGRLPGIYDAKFRQLRTGDEHVLAIYEPVANGLATTKAPTPAPASLAKSAPPPAAKSAPPKPPKPASNDLHDTPLLELPTDISIPILKESTESLLKDTDKPTPAPVSFDEALPTFKDDDDAPAPPPRRSAPTVMDMSSNDAPDLTALLSDAPSLTNSSKKSAEKKAKPASGRKPAGDSDSNHDLAPKQDSDDSFEPPDLSLFDESAPPKRRKERTPVARPKKSAPKASSHGDDDDDPSIDGPDLSLLLEGAKGLGGVNGDDDEFPVDTESPSYAGKGYAIKDGKKGKKGDKAFVPPKDLPIWMNPKLLAIAATVIVVLIGVLVLRSAM